MTSTDSIIAALHSFEPTDDETENVGHLYEVLEPLRASADRERAIPAMFAFLERHPDKEFGSPGPIVHELEAIPGYEPFLRESLSRQPLAVTNWMVSRILNSDLTDSEREEWLEVLRKVTIHPLVDEFVREDAQEIVERHA